MRNLVENPFINHQCQLLEIEKAPINTNIYETYGQCNEDLIVEGILRAITIRSGRSMNSIRYVEIGANHPVQTSSTYLLYRLFGACGVLVDANPKMVERLRAIRSRDVVVHTAISTSTEKSIAFNVHEKDELSSVSRENIARFEGFGGVDKIVETISCPNMHINEFMAKYAPVNVDYMSVDIEGLDAAVLSAMDTAYQPIIMQCEHNGNMAQFGSIFASRNYSLVAQTDVNAIYVRRGIF